MNVLQSVYPGDALASFLIRVLAEITLVTLGALFLTRFAVRGNPAMRHGICICALLCVMIAPVTTFGLERLGWSTFQISLEQNHPTSSLQIGNAINATSNTQLAPDSGFWTLERARTVACLILLVWFVGSGVLLYRLAVGSRKVGRLRRSAREIQNPKLDSVVQSLIALEQMPAVPIRFSSRVHSPIVVGPRRTTVILPEKLLDRLDEGQLRCVLAHELTHVRQKDPLVGLIQRLVEASYWPHPLVHVLNRDLARAREEVCDNVALHGTTAPQYADTLLTVALGITPTLAMPGAVGLMTRPWRLEERVKGLLDPQRRLNTTMNIRQLALMGIALVSGTVLIGGARIVAAPYPPHAQDTLDLFTHYDQRTHRVTVTHKLTRKSAFKKQQSATSRVSASRMKIAQEANYSVRLVEAPVSLPPMLLKVHAQPATPRQLVSLQTSTVLPVGPASAAPPVSSIAPVPPVQASTPSTSAVIVSGSAVAQAKGADSVVSIATTKEPVDVVRTKGVDRSFFISSDGIHTPLTLNLGSGATSSGPSGSRDVVIREIHGQSSTSASSSTTTEVPSNSLGLKSDQVTGASAESSVIYGLATTRGVVSGQASSMSGDGVQTLTVVGSRISAVTQLPSHPLTYQIKSTHVDNQLITSIGRNQPANGSSPPFETRLGLSTHRNAQTFSYWVSSKSDPARVTTVYIDGDHVKVVGENIKIVYVHSKAAKTHSKAKTDPKKP